MNPTTESRYFSTLTGDVIQALATQPMLMHLHERGIPLEYYQTYPKLAQTLRVISTNDIDGQVIVSTAEALEYPIYMTQYHPEVVYEPVPDLLARHDRLSYKFG